MPKGIAYECGGTADQLAVPQIYDNDHGASPTASHGTTVAWSIIDWASSHGGTLPEGVGVQDSSEEQLPVTLEHPTLDRQHSNEEGDVALPHVDHQKRQLTTLHEAGSSFLRRYAKLAPIREQALSLRTRVGFELNNCMSYRGFVTEAQTNFLKESESFLASIPSELSSERLLALHNQVLQDHERHDEHARKAREMETSLSDLEFSLQGKEYRLAMAASKIMEILNEIDLPGESGSVTAVETEPSCSPSEAESIELPPLVQHYFDKAGDVKLGKEHLEELELEHREAREARIFFADQDRPLSRSNEEFEDMYLKAYTKGELALADATRKAEMAKEMCLLEDLDPDAYRKASSQHENERTETPAHQTPSSQAFQGYDDVPTDMKVSVLNLSEEAQDGQIQKSAPASPTNRRRKRTKARPNQRIQDWMEAINDDADGTQSRSWSVSESPDPLPIFEKREDGTLAFNRKSPQAQGQRYEKRGSLASISVAFANKAKQQRPTPLKKSSSESELIIYPSRTTSREDVLQGLRTYATELGRP